MRLVSTSIFFGFAGLTLSVFCTCVVTRSQADSTSNNGDVPTVTYCELTRTPDRFHERVVRINAIYENGFEKSYLYDPECRGGQSEMWVSHDKSFVLKGDSEEAKKNRMISGFGRWSVTVVGKFVRAQAPERFGHLGCCRYQIELVRIEKSEKLPDKKR
jgi:hypothetical protein